MRRRAHFPWRQLIGAVILFAILTPIMDQALAAARSAPSIAVPDDRGSSGPPAKDGGDGDGQGESPQSGPEGDPDDYGDLPPLILRFILLLNFCR